MSDLLPHNASPQEVALDEATARVGDVPVLVREAWDPNTCPPHVLPWLAWALSIDQWETDWSDEQKRSAIKTSVAVQRAKGTVSAVRDSLRALDIEARVLEWHRQEVIGPEFTYRLFIEARAGAPVVSLEQIESVIAVVDRAKSLRSHLELIEISSVVEAGPYLGAAAVCGSEIVVKYGGGGLTVSDINIVVG